MPCSSAAPSLDQNFRLAAEDIPNVVCCRVSGINVYDIPASRQLVLVQGPIVALEERFK